MGFKRPQVRLLSLGPTENCHDCGGSFFISRTCGLIVIPERLPLSAASEWGHISQGVCLRSIHATRRFDSCHSDQQRTVTIVAVLFFSRTCGLIVIPERLPLSAASEWGHISQGVCLQSIHATCRFDSCHSDQQRTVTIVAVLFCFIAFVLYEKYVG